MIEVRGLHPVVLCRFHEVVRAEGKIEFLLGVQVDIPKADLVGTVGILVVPLVKGDDGLAARPQDLLVEDTFGEGRHLCLDRGHEEKRQTQSTDAKWPPFHRSSRLMTAAVLAHPAFARCVFQSVDKKSLTLLRRFLPDGRR
jgi:hypothetical protein